MKMFRKDEGFTLVELMVVVLIIGILVAIAIPVFNAAQASARQRTCLANQRTLDGAAQQYLATNSTATSASVNAPSVLVPNYVKQAPECPTNGTPYTMTNASVNGCPDNATTAHGTYTD